MKVLALVHTVPPLLEVFSRLAAELLPGVRLLHILDEPLLERIKQRGLADEDAGRLGMHVAIAAQAGSDAVLVTCSTVSPLVDQVRPYAPIPVVKIDEAMIAEAVRLGRRIGVVATNPPTLEPTRQLLEIEAQRAGKAVETELLLADGAFAALLSGDGDTHDRLVREAATTLAPRSDVIVLAQASMARALSSIPETERAVPILASPQLALARVKALVDP